MPDTPELIKALLNSIKDPVSGLGLTDAGLVRGLVVTLERIGFMLEVPPEFVPLYKPVRDQAEALLLAQSSVNKIQIILTAQTVNPSAPKARLSDQTVAQNRPKAPVASQRPAHVKYVVVVGSGKGGVGKSTVSLNLALGLAAMGLSIGFLDADIYGPSAPLMLGLSGAPEFGDDKLMVPHEAFGLKVNSVGFLMKDDEAMIWRGPMASQALSQLLTGTRWGTVDTPLDVLVVDMPPGTGDVQLTLTQKTLIDGAVVVTTPQQMALIDARRAVTLFEKTGVKVLGLVENMAYLTGPDGSIIDIFGRGGAHTLTTQARIDLLCEVPLDVTLREACDMGVPLTATAADGPVAMVFKHLAQAVYARLSAQKE
jgi:ATP-binding protein involved in chromosome partitioning